MTSLKITAILLLLLTFSITAIAQTVEGDDTGVNCPKIEVIGPPAVVQRGETMDFRVEFEETDRTLGFNWSTDKGKIIGDIGVEVIRIGETEELNNETVTVKLIVEGLPEDCESTYSGTGIVVSFGDPIMFDEFGELPDPDVRARVDNLIITLQESPDMDGSIFIYGKSKARENRRKLILKQISKRKFPAGRIHLIDGGLKKTISTRIWVHPTGVDNSIFY